VPKLCFQGYLQAARSHIQKGPGKIKMLVFTTSRNPTKETRALARFFCRAFSARYFSRQGSNISELAEKARFNGFKTIVVVKEKSGKPECFQVIEIGKNAFKYRKGFSSLEKLKAFLKKVK